MYDNVSTIYIQLVDDKMKTRAKLSHVIWFFLLSNLVYGFNNLMVHRQCA